MTTTLTDRYVLAATRWLPGKTKTEVEAELRERIADTIAARPETADAERLALEELGDPLRVALDYTGRQPMLIGPRFFFTWLRLTALLVLLVPTIIAALSIVGAVIDGDSVAKAIAGAFGVFFQIAIQVAFWTTLVFAVLDWTNAPPEAEDWTIADLPEPNNGETIGDLIAGLIFLPLLAGLLIWQHLDSPVRDGGVQLPVLDPALWSWYIPLMLGLLVLELGHLIWVYRAGWTWPAAAANAAISLVFAVPTSYLLTRHELLNPAVAEHFGWDSGIVETVATWTLVAVMLISLWEVIDGFIKAARNR